MVFSTHLFVFLFLPAFLALYYASPSRLKSYVICGASYAFYGWWRVEYVLLIFGVSALTYLAAQITLRSTSEKVRKRALVMGVVFDLLVLGYFKYAVFFANNIDGILTFAGQDGLDFYDVLLPIGISFHTFQSISFLIDMYRKDAPPPDRFIDFLAFSAMFPQLIAGPVLRYKDLAEQFKTRVHSLEKFTRGMYRFIIGLAMKVLIADSLAPMADLIFASQNPTFVESWLGALAYTFQLFFDFAGYSAMAIGLGLMIGFNFPENFNRPYISRSITEFWRRWHITLSSWLRDYLYIPLGGNRLGQSKTLRNIVLTMVLGGFWHGANWTFIIWGFWHGGLMALERVMGSKQSKSVWPERIALPFTFFLVVLGWVIFRSPTVAQSLQMYQGMFGLNGFGVSDAIAWQLRTSEIAILALASALCFLPRTASDKAIFNTPATRTAAHTALLALVTVKMSASTYSPFLYFQF
ncbi:MBOAT family O-acyltransferase [Cognatishimia maritima]|uniref:Probable alginate O-acetylase AlgI n=1 Tax=Cognatishimia maritima TaxID=870908 RepID=A0A1M5P247_9RHOB|nr:MBOAT family protein [Cognatishimia maritima]SHG95904.1 alginate O-acetyltransferase complex protein AlgI [Cognatishimia maritima]